MGLPRRSAPSPLEAPVLTAAQAGAPWALERLWRELSPVVVGYLRVQGASEPEDMASETFLAAFRTLRSFRGSEAQFRSWVFTIAHNRLVDERRRDLRRPPRPAEPAESAAERLPGGDVEGEALQALSRDRVRGLCAQLPPDQRDVVVLRLVSGMTLGETAAALGKSVGAVKALQHRAVNRLRRIVVGETARSNSPEGVSR